MPIDVVSTEHFVFLKTNAYESENGIDVDTIPLKCETVQINVAREIPTIKVPTGIPRGESTTIAIDLGMGTKTISLSGIITNTTIKRSHTGSTGNYTSLNMTAIETAQLIASGVDSSALAKYQNFNELVLMVDSNIDEDYVERASVLRMPFSFSSRGGALEKDNARVPLPSDFPTGANQATLDKETGIGGYIESFDFTIDGNDPSVISFNLTFRVATTFP
tara:strand:+ start:1696 stop:2355 length:660 start_codon:yes stop_codon:yes gene_type:complete